jgi:hypothetical protein
MKRIYYPYWEWEDFINGMYETTSENESDLISLSENLLSNTELFRKSAIEMCDKWVKSTIVNLTNKNCNQRAWIGQASCCYSHKCPEYLTRIAWKNLNEETRRNADKIADQVIMIYKRKYEKKNNQIYFDMGI